MQFKNMFGNACWEPDIRVSVITKTPSSDLNLAIGNIYLNRKGPNLVMICCIFICKQQVFSPW